MADDLGPLSERELEVLRLVATGATNQQIARALVISPNTVKVHLRNIFDKLEVQSRTEATMEAVRRGWLAVPNGVTLPVREEAAAAAAAAATPGGEEAAEAVPDEAAAAAETLAMQPAPIALWQRVYLIAAAVAVILALFTPGWIQSRSQTPRATPFSDIGQPQAAPPSRPQVARWTGRNPLPAARSRLALIADGERLYAIGGETADGVTDEVAIYDPPTNSWSAGTRKPTAVANVAAASLGGRIFVPGGTTATGGVTNALEVYDHATATWEARAPLPTPTAAYALACLGGKLYLFGGWDGQAYRRDVLIYDPETDSWAAATPMPEPRGFLAAGVLEGLIYVVGGYNGAQELDTVSVYDPAGEGTAAGPWSERTPLSQPRGGLAAAVIGSRLYTIGGGWSQALAFNEQYDAASGAWSRIATPVPGQWRNLGLAVYAQKLYAVGGWSGSYLATVEEYQALVRQLLPMGSKGG